MSDVFHPPWFEFYPDNFIVGTTGFTAEEAGAYILLICYAWSNGGVPRDFEKLARIAHIPTAQRMSKLWKTLAEKFVDDPADPEMMKQPTVERLRVKAEAYYKKQAENGKRGGRPKKPKENPPDNPTETQGLTQTKPNEKQTKTKDNSASLRSAAIGSYPTIPEDPEAVRGLAMIFVQRFANCADLGKAKRHVLPYASAIAGLRRDGLTVAQAWDAFEALLKANGEKPIFGGECRNVYNFKPGRVAQKHAAKANDRGEEMDRAIAAKIQRQGATA